MVKTINKQLKRYIIERLYYNWWRNYRFIYCVFPSKEGHKVTVIDKSNFSSGASYVNAGIITPSHIISLAAPGIINKGIKWMFSSTSPFLLNLS